MTGQVARGVSEFDSTVTCRCGHGPTAHDHYRRGTDCGLCECLRFRTTQASVLARLLERRGIRRESVAKPVARPVAEPVARPVAEPARADVHAAHPPLAS